jgi:mannose-1-phosphate guanylyltransferase/mannose-1-phosphate guanylyltransferase/mannose-6-phosphate isomerase
MPVTAIQPVVLCGGAGTRLWPLSTAERPKPFLHLGHDGSLLAATLARFAGHEGFLEPIIVGSAAHGETIEAEVGKTGKLVLEPSGRNTAPALAAAALLLEPPSRLLLVMPSDHVIQDIPAFLAAIDAAAPFAQEGWLMTFGIRPTRAETGFGYIRRGSALGDGVFEAASFVEKPDRATAEAYIAAEDHDWNAGIFLLRADRYLEELMRYAPDVAIAVEEAVARASRDGNRVALSGESFGRSPSTSIDVAVMERAERVGVDPVDIGWSDVGSWNAVYEAGEGSADDAGNIVRGPVEVENSRGCYLHSNGPRIVALDVDDLVIVATADGVLVTRRGGGDGLKPLLERREAGD